MTNVRIYSAGSNARGQLSSGSDEDSHIFTSCILSPEIADWDISEVDYIAAGANHTLALIRRSDGTSGLIGCGDGTKGQLGPDYRKKYGVSNSFKPIDLPQIFGDRYQIKYIAASWETSFIAVANSSEDDLLFSTGSNEFGELGVSVADKGDVTADSVYSIDLKSTLTSKDDRKYIRITGLKAGPRHVVARVKSIATDGSEVSALVGWGASRHGQLGISRPQTTPCELTSPEGNIIRDVSSFALGNQHSIFLQHSNLAFGLGSNKKNQLSGISAVINTWILGATWNGTYLVTEESKSGNRWRVYGTGSNAHGQLGLQNTSDSDNARPAEIKLPGQLEQMDIVEMACGSEHVLILVKHPVTSLTEVWGWGWNEHGNLGLGHTNDILQPTKLWPPAAAEMHYPSNVIGIWAGCGTSWIAVKDAQIPRKNMT